MFLLTKKQTDTLIKQTKTKLQETLQFKMTKQIQPCSFNPPINLSEDSKWLLAMTPFVKSLMKTIVFQFEHKVISFQKVVKNLLTS